MNKAILMGRLTRDPDLRTTPSQVSVATFTLAVDRRYKSASGERPTDFINIVAWRGLADFVGNYCKKGTKLVVVGNIQTRTYDDKDGKRVYVTEIVADEIEFAESKGASSGNTDQGSSYQERNEQTKESSPSDSEDSFITVDDDDTSLPFDI
jgi:single-strand DNA-binding protein